VAGGGAHGVAEVGLLVDFLGTGAGTAIGEEFVGSETGALGAVDDVEQAELDGIGHRDAVVEVPGFGAGAGLLGELVEEGILAVVSGPDGEVATPGDTALGDFPKEFGVGMFGEFVESDIAAVNGHGMGIGGEGDDAGAVVEFDVADFDFFGEGGGLAEVVEAINFEAAFPVVDDGAGEVEELGKAFGLEHVFEGGGIIFGDEEVVAFGEAEAFADVFEAVTKGPANANGFLGEDEGALMSGAERFLGLNPVELVGDEVFGQEGVGVDGDGGEDGGHGGS
jgi:hypothetical protein